MNATCQVTYLDSGRTRLHISNVATQPEAYHRLVQLALSLPQVTRVELEQGNGTVTLIHSSAPQSRQAILQTLRGGSAQKPAPAVEATAPPMLPDAPVPTCLAEASAPAAAVALSGPGTLTSAPVEKSLTAPPGPPPARSPYADGAVAHAMQGRLRLRIPVLQSDGALAGVLAHFLSQQPGVQDVRLSRLSGGIAIAFDPAVTDARSLARLIGGYRPDAAVIAGWKSSRLSRRPRQRRQNVVFQASLAMAAAALALNWLGAPGLLVFVLLLAASWPIIRRAGQRLLVQRQFSLELLAVTAVLLLWVTGRSGQAAGVVAALAAIEWLRTSPYASLDHALAGGLDWMRAFSASTPARRQLAAPRQTVAIANPANALSHQSVDSSQWLAPSRPAAASVAGNSPALIVTASDLDGSTSR